MLNNNEGTPIILKIHALLEKRCCHIRMLLYYFSSWINEQNKKKLEYYLIEKCSKCDRIFVQRLSAFSSTQFIIHLSEWNRSEMCLSRWLEVRILLVFFSSVVMTIFHAWNNPFFVTSTSDKWNNNGKNTNARYRGAQKTVETDENRSKNMLQLPI